jgi:hypothetical protein
MRWKLLSAGLFVALAALVYFWLTYVPCAENPALAILHTVFGPEACGPPQNPEVLRPR